MNIQKKLLGIRAIPVLAAAVLGAASLTGPAFAADHGDAPLAKANVPLDINDVYAFGGEGGTTQTANSVTFVMTVNPLTMPGATPNFDQGGLYQFRIDNNGDAVPDVTYNVKFGAPSGGTQSVEVRKATGASADALSNSGSIVVSGDTTAATAAPDIAEDNNYRLFAGLRDDPFFFDLNAFKAGLAFRNPGNDFFKGTNITAIVLEVPESEFQASGSPDTGAKAGVWGVTSKGSSVIDRMGRPAIATVFIPADKKDAFNNTKPVNDVASWKSTVVSALNGLGSDPALADALLPDILTFDTGKPLNFLNGRALADDVIDGELQLITGNSAASDNVGSNDNAFSSAFPYLAAPNTGTAPTPIPVATGTVTGAPTAPAATATRPTGVVAPDTGTGDGTAGGTDTVIWLSLGLAAAAVIAAGGAVAVRNRR